MTQEELKYLKWKIDLADGFEYLDGSVLFGEKDYPLRTYFDSDLFRYLCSSLIVQRAIEGINNKLEIVESISQDESEIGIDMKNGEHFTAIIEDIIDNAKEAGLKYVYKKVVKS